MLALLCVIPGPVKHNPLTTGLPGDRPDGFGQALQEAPMEKKEALSITLGPQRYEISGQRISRNLPDGCYRI